jgi:uncharacterized protein with FMN-binding domain
MRRAITALLSAATVALPAVNGAAAATHSTGKATAKKRVVTKKLVGQAAEADRWGTVQVNITVRTITVAGSRKVTRKYIDLGGRYSYHTDRSQYIMSQSLPILRQEFLAAQSARIQMVSGATNTSQAFMQSLQSALLKANA